MFGNEDSRNGLIIWYWTYIIFGRYVFRWQWLFERC